MFLQSEIICYRRMLTKARRSELGAYECDLVARCVQHDSAAFRTICEVHYPRVYRVAFKIVKSHDDAADVAQEVFLKVHTQLSKFRGDCALSSWLHRVSANTALMYIRRNKKFSRREVSSDHLDTIPSECHSPMDTAANRQMIETLRLAWVQLNPDEQQLLTWRVEDESLDYIAQQLEITLAAAKSRVFRARASLSTAMAAI